MSCGFDPAAAPTVRKIREMGLLTVLATNPQFPSVATEKRMAWAGLSPTDFELFTTYENSTRCKPNPEYYTEILGKIGARADECLMVGNDVDEDMIAESLGMKVFLMPRDLISRTGGDLSRYRQGDFSDLLEYISELLSKTE
jgi:FMN phosphatase YigB (HAD superfamily)